MIKRIYLVILVLLFATPGIFAQQSVKVGDVIAGPGTVEVPVYMYNFTNVNGFQLAFNINPDILTPVTPSEDSYFVKGDGKVWIQSVVTEDEVVISFLDMGFTMVGGAAVFSTHNINGEVFKLKFNYAGAFPADIDFNVSNSSIMVNGGDMNLTNVAFDAGSVTPDPDAALGTLKLGNVPEAVIGTEYVVPVSLVGAGFGAIRGLQIEVEFDPNKLVFNGLNNIPGSGIVFDAILDDNLVSFVWIGAEKDFTEEAVIAGLRFIYNSNEEASVTFTSKTAVSVALGEIPYDQVNGLFTPKALDLKLTIGDVYQYSGANVDIPLVLSGVEDAITAGAMTIRLGFDPDLMRYASIVSPLGFNVPASGNDGILVLNFVAGDQESGYTLANGTIATIRFNFLEVGKTDINFLFGPSGTAFTTFQGGVIPISYVNGAAEVSVPGIVFDGLVDARENTTLVLTNPDFNEIVETTTYPTTFITSSGQPFFFPVLTNAWMIDGFLHFSEDLVAGTVITGTDGTDTFDYVLAADLPANTLLSWKDMILAVAPEENLEWPLLDEAGTVEVWTYTFRSPVTIENVVMTSVIATSHDGWVASEDGVYPGFVLASDDITFTLHGDPQLLFAFNGELASTGSEFEFCYSEEVTVTLADKLEGGTIFDITYTVNGEETTVEGVEIGDAIWGPELLAAGTYEVVVTNIVDNFGRDVVNPEDIYVATVVINPEPFVYFAFNGVTAAPESEFVYCFDEEVTVTLSEIGEGVAPFEVTYTVNGVEETVTGLAAGDELFSALMEAGTYEIVVTSIIDGNGCAVSADVLEAVYFATVVINPMPAVLFAFNDEVVVTDSALEFCEEEEVTVSLFEIVDGTGPIEITYVLNEDEAVVVADLEAGAVLFTGTLPVGSHTLVVTSIVDANGCAVANAEEIYKLTIEVHPLPDVTILNEGELEFCDGESVVLSVAEAASYLWSNGSTEQSITVNESGIFTVTVTSEFGCVATSEEVEVVVHELPVAEITFEGALEFCAGGSVTLVASEGASYLWSNDATTKEVTVSAAGEYFVTVTNEFGCESTSDVVVVAVWALPVVTCPNDTTVMLSHAAFALTGATPAGGVYSGAGVANGQFNAQTATVGDHVITYTYTDGNGCVAECTFVITVKLDTNVPTTEAAAIKLYPNPARTYLTIESADVIKEIRLVDMLGQVVYSDVVQYQSYQLNVSDFKNGIYFVQVLTEKGFTTHRVQVTR